MAKCLGVRYALINTKKMPAARILHELMREGIVQAVPVRTEFSAPGEENRVFVVAAKGVNKTTLRRIPKEQGWA